MWALAFVASDFLRGFLDNPRVPGAENTAINWLIAATVIASVCTAGAMIFKAARKSMATRTDQRIWSRGETILLILAWMGPVLLVTVAVWYLTRNFYNIVGVGGLFKGIALGWLLYLALTFIAHLASPWRRELI